MKGGDRGGFRTLICAWEGEAQYPVHLLYLRTAPQLNCFFSFAFKAVQILGCLVLPCPFGSKRCLVLVCQSRFGLIAGRIQHHVPGMPEQCVPFTPPPPALLFLMKHKCLPVSEDC